jgi:HEPN domain-containing protein
MVSKESSIYFKTAEEQLEDAKLAFKEERYALCAFLSASSAENATAALLRALGATPSKKHRNSLVLYKLAQNVPQLQEDLLNIVELMKVLELHITRTRYPIRKGLKLLSPGEYYTRKIAEEAMIQAQKVIRKVRQLAFE